MPVKILTRSKVIRVLVVVDTDTWIRTTFSDTSSRSREAVVLAVAAFDSDKIRHVIIHVGVCLCARDELLDD